MVPCLIVVLICLRMEMKILQGDTLNSSQNVTDGVPDFVILFNLT